MFKDLCRLCGLKHDKTLDIFSELGSNQKLELKIKQIVRLSILEEDPLPKIVCVSCIKRLENASSFIDHCHQTQTYLNQLYQDNTPPTLISSNFDPLTTTETRTNDGIIIENSEILISKSTLVNDLVSKTSAINFTSIENCNQSISKNHIDDYTDENYSEPGHASNTTCKSQNDSISQNSNYKLEDDLFHEEKIIDDEVSIIDDEVNNVSSNDTRSSKDNSRNTISQIPADCKITTNNRSQLKRKCTSQSTSITNQDNSSDESSCERIDQSDYSYSGDSNNDEDYEISNQSFKKNPQKSKSISNTNKNNAKKYTTRNSIAEQTKTNVKETDTSRKESKDRKRLQCDTCKKTFSQQLTYQEHLNVHTGNRPFSCKLCTASFRRRQELNQHLRTIHSEKQFKCPSCDHVAKHKGKLTEHIKSVHDKPFACDMCDYRTGEKGKIMQHIANKHTADLSFVCEICGNGFKTKCSLQVHIRNIHFPEPKVCQICGTVCPSLARYSSHIFRCGKEKKRHHCEKCGKSYVNKEILRDHMNKHLNIKPYKCDVCGKEFFQRNRLDTHKYVHRGANYQCEICCQSFNRKDNMKNHMKRHFYKSMRCDNTIVTAV